MSEICYKKVFLKEVASQIDFFTPMKELFSEGLPVNIAESLKERFPIAESSKGFIQNVEISPEGPKTSQTNFSQWIFHGNDRSKTICINEHFINVSLKKYGNYDDFREDFVNPISKVMELKNNIQIKRTGIRFINVFDNIENYSEINKYFSSMLSNAFMNQYKQDDCTRSVLVFEYLFGDIKVRLQAGIFNPDYPAKITRKHFVIDIDAFTDFPHIISNVQEYFGKFHEAIQNVFEYCITEELRKFMNE